MSVRPPLLSSPRQIDRPSNIMGALPELGQCIKNTLFHAS